MKVKSNKNIWIFLAVAFVIYFFTAFYYNYQAESTMASADLSDEERSMCDLKELDGDRLSLTVPPTYVNDASQADLDAAAKANGYESITLNENGSATYVITKAQHLEMLDKLSQGIREKMASIPGNGSYKNITSVDSDDDFTEFEIHTKVDKLSDKESMSAINLKLLSTMYHAFKGEGNAPFAVIYYGKDGSVIAKTD